MSLNEEAPRESKSLKENIPPDFDDDSLYVRVLKHAMRKLGVTAEVAGGMSKKQLMEHPESGSPNLKLIDKAVAEIKLQQEKNKKS